MSAFATPPAADAPPLPSTPARRGHQAAVLPSAAAAFNLHAFQAGLSGAGSDVDAPAVRLRRLIDAGLDRLPLPAAGATLQRWQALATVAAHDLSLAKLYEGHTDALAVLQELQAAPPPAGACVGMWAAEPPDGRVTFTPQAGGEVRLQGTKRWCSGAAHVTHGLLTAWHEDGSGPWLVLVDMAQPGVQVQADGWRAVGMADSQSLDVQLDGCSARLCGREGDYLRRPGFWQGGVGVAACWYGGCVALGEALRRAELQSRRGPPERRHAAQVALGHADVELHALAASLREAAAWIDRHPRQEAQSLALRVRSAVDAAAQRLLVLAGRAVGATPYCRDRHFARLAADLPVFVRQTHADRDLAALARLCASSADADEDTATTDSHGAAAWAL